MEYQPLTSTSSAPEPHPLIDVTRLVYRHLGGRLPTGIDRVCLAYLRHFSEAGSCVLAWRGLLLAYPRGASRVIAATLLDGGRRSRLRLVWQLAIGALSAWLARPAKGTILLHVAHMGLEHEAYWRAVKSAGCRAVVMVHDLIPITHPEFCRPGEREQHLSRMRNVIANAEAVIANSMQTAKSLEAFGAEQSCELPPLTVAHLAVDPALCVAGSPVLSAPAEPFFLVIGTLEPRKNHWMMLQLWRQLHEQEAGDAPRLVLVGARGWEIENLEDMLDRSPVLRSAVVEMPRCTDAQLAWLLQRCRAVLFPSFVEGFGLPLLEAIALGVPVIASDLPVFRELAGDVPDYCDPLDGQRWRQLVKDYARPDSISRSDQLARMASVRLPSWSEHFRHVEAFLAHD